MIAVSLHLVYSLPSRVRLFLSLYFFCRAKLEVVGEVSGSVCVLNKPRGGVNTHSLFEGFFCAKVHFEAKPSKVIRKEGDPFFDVGPGFKKNAPSSTYSMHNRSNSVPDKKMPGRWLNNCLVDLGEFSLRANWALFSPRAIHSSSSVLVKVVIKNRNSNEAMMSPYLTPNLKSMDVSTLPMMSMTMISLYMRLIDENCIGGAPYFPSMAMSHA